MRAGPRPGWWSPRCWCSAKRRPPLTRRGRSATTASMSSTPTSPTASVWLRATRDSQGRSWISSGLAVPAGRSSRCRTTTPRSSRWPTYRSSQRACDSAVRTRRCASRHRRLPSLSSPRPSARGTASSCGGNGRTRDLSPRCPRSPRFSTRASSRVTGCQTTLTPRAHCPCGSRSRRSTRPASPPRPSRTSSGCPASASRPSAHHPPTESCAGHQTSRSPPCRPSATTGSTSASPSRWTARSSPSRSSSGHSLSAGRDCCSSTAATSPSSTRRSNRCASSSAKPRASTSGNRTDCRSAGGTRASGQISKISPTRPSRPSSGASCSGSCEKTHHHPWTPLAGSLHPCARTSRRGSTGSRSCGGTSSAASSPTTWDSARHFRRWPSPSTHASRLRTARAPRRSWLSRPPRWSRTGPQRQPSSPQS